MNLYFFVSFLKINVVIVLLKKIYMVEKKIEMLYLFLKIMIEYNVIKRNVKVKIIL